LVEIAGHKVLDEMRAMPELQDARINGDLRGRKSSCTRGSISRELGVSVQNISQTIASQPWATCRKTARSFLGRSADPDSRQLAEARGMISRHWRICRCHRSRRQRAFETVADLASARVFRPCAATI